MVDAERLGARLERLEHLIDVPKQGMADLVMARPASEVYDASEPVGRPEL